VASGAFEAIVGFLRSTELLGGAHSTPESLREAMVSNTGMIVLPDDVAIDSVDAGGVPAEWVRVPGAATDAVVLYLHGGGYVIGSPSTHRNLCATLARLAGVDVLSLDYRLAPEHPHPAAVYDATAAYSWLLSAGFAPERIAVAGDSAGGGLALATLVKLRDDGVSQPAAAIAISPWVDIAMTGDTMRTLAEADPMVKPEGLGLMADWFIGGGDKLDPLASPLYADLAGLAPVLIHVGEVETLLDDARRLHAALVAAGGDSTLVEYPEMVHVFHAFCGLVPEADAAVGEAAEFVRKRLGL
jgi:epsilon-lactone hydrolase